MRNISKLALPMIIALGGSACKNSSSSVSPENPAVMNHKSGTCGTQVQADYKDLQLKCGASTVTQLPSDFRACKVKCQNFLAAYPEVNCTFINNDDTSSRPTTVTASQIQEWIDTFTRQGY